MDIKDPNVVSPSAAISNINNVDVVDFAPKKLPKLTGADAIIAEASKRVGEMETHGKNRSPYIDSCNVLVGAPLGSPWCVSSLSMWHHEAGLNNPMSAYSPDWFKKQDCIYIRGSVITGPVLPGDCGGIYFPSKKRIAHGFLIVGVDNGWLMTIEGNSNDDGSREGNAVVRRKRILKSVERISRFHK